jgi:ABC-type glutathione transport system ATPase component
LRGLLTQGRGLLVSTHDVDFVRACADRAVLLEDGVVAAAGRVDAVLARL